MTHVFAIFGLAASCAVWVLIQRAADQTGCARADGQAPCGGRRTSCSCGARDEACLDAAPPGSSVIDE